MAGGGGRDNAMGPEGGTAVGRGLGCLTLLQKLYLGWVAGRQGPRLRPAEPAHSFVVMASALDCRCGAVGWANGRVGWWWQGMEDRRDEG